MDKYTPALLDRSGILRAYQVHANVGKLDDQICKQAITPTFLPTISRTCVWSVVGTLVLAAYIKTSC